MADKRQSSTTAAPLSSSANATSMNRAALAEQKLDMSLDDILKKKRTEEPKKKAGKKSTTAKPARKLAPEAKSKLGAIVKQTKQRATAAERRKKVLASVKAKTIGRKMDSAAKKGRAVDRSSSVTADLSKRIQMPLSANTKKTVKSSAARSSGGHDIYRPPKAKAVSNVDAGGSRLKIVIPPKHGSAAARTPAKKVVSRSNTPVGGGVLGALRAAASAAVQERQHAKREEQLAAKRRVVVPGQQLRAESPTPSPAAPKTLNDRFSALQSSNGSPAPSSAARPRLSDIEDSRYRNIGSPAAAVKPTFNVTLKGAREAPNSKIRSQRPTQQHNNHDQNRRNVRKGDSGGSLQRRLTSGLAGRSSGGRGGRFFRGAGRR